MAYLNITFRILLIFFFNMSFMFGQEINGKIFDKHSQEPLENVSIFLNNNITTGTFTDKNGAFNLKLDPRSLENDSITFSMIGYKTYSTNVSSLRNTSNTIYMSSLLDTLNQVEIRSGKLQTKINYEKLTSLRFGLHSFASIIVDNKLYISGGDKSNYEDTFREAMERASAGAMEPNFEDVLRFWRPNGSYNGYSDKLLIYNLDTNIWTTSNLKFEKRAYHQIVCYENELYILGGKKIANFTKAEYLLNQIEIVNIDNETLVVDDTNPHQAVDFASFIYKDNIIVMGGSTGTLRNGDKIFTDKIHQFDLKTGLWYDLDKMNTPKEVSGLLIDDKIYLIGGFDDQPIALIESWDLTTGKWTSEGNMFSGIAKPALTSQGNIIYIYDSGSLLIYNTRDNTLKTYAINLYLKTAAMHFYKNKLYIIGGYKESENATKPSSSVYTVDVAEFERTEVVESKFFKSSAD